MDCKLTPEQKALYERLNDRQKKFAIGIIEGKSQPKAYLDAGYADNNSVRANASRMRANEGVSAFLDATLHPMQESAAENAILSREEALMILSDIAKTSINDVLEWRTASFGEDPETGEEITQSLWSVKDSAMCDDRKMGAIEEVTAGKAGLKVKMANRQAAIKQLSDMMGWNAPSKTEVKAKVESDVTVRAASKEDVKNFLGDF